MMGDEQALAELAMMLKDMSPKERDAFRAALLDGRTDYLKSAAERAKQESREAIYEREQAELVGKMRAEIAARPGMGSAERALLRDRYRREHGFESNETQEERAARLQPAEPDQPSRLGLIAAYNAEIQGAGSSTLKRVIRDRFRRSGLTDEDMASR